MSTTNVRSMTIAELQAERIVRRATIDDYARRGLLGPLIRDIWERIEAIDREVWARQDAAEAK